MNRRGSVRRVWVPIPPLTRTPPRRAEGSPATEMISHDGVINEKGLEDFMAEVSPATRTQLRRAEGSPATEMISQDGELNEKGLEEFMKLHDCGVSYAVVAIMGPQSSGKSTLLNHLFHTNFSEMDASSGRGKTTNGIWIAKAQNIKDPCIMVMDVEGTDGQERGQDGTTFEKRSTLFALEVADIFFINIWCHDIGRENAANRPLLKTIFEVMMQIFSSRRRKATLHFIIRDKTKSPIEALQTKLKTDIQKIWEIVPKTEGFKDTSLSDFFNVEVDALSHYELGRRQFREEVIQLRERILNSIRVAGDRGVVIPTSRLTSHVKKLWEIIKENKELDLPTHKEMVATVRCEEIAEEKLKLFASDKEWLKLEAAAKVRLFPGFGAETGLIWSRYLSEYDSESAYFQEDVRNAKKRNLASDAFDVVHQAYINTLNHLRAEVFKNFERELEKVLNGGGGYAESVATCLQSCEDEFDERCLDAAANAIKKQAEWDASFVREELVHDVENHALAVRTDKLSQFVHKRQARLATKVSEHLHDLFSLINDKGFSWPRIRSFLKRESDLAASALCSDIASFELDKATVEQKVLDLKQYARELVESKFKEETKSVLQHMEDRFMLSCLKKEQPYPECLKVLSTMAAIRLDESLRDGEVERLLFSALIDRDDDNTLASCTWEEVPPEMTLITPVECKDIWKKFHGVLNEKGLEDFIAEVAPVTRTQPRRAAGSPATRTPPRRAEGSPATEMISQDGVLNEKGLEDFMKLHECGVSYAVVAIMGPQSSGKSTLLNHLFHTNFSEMDASSGRGKTTNGIWIAKALNKDPCIMVMDIEGTDGQERGQDGTTFEKRSTLFALEVADIFFINIWCHDIGRENAANRPLLKTIFEVMMQIFSSRRRKATLHFIIRDKTKSPIEALQTKLKTDIQKIWEIVPKTEGFKDTSLSDFFNVEVDALSNYEHARQQFIEEVIQLRERILNSIRVSSDRGVVIPTSGLTLHVKKLWETIKENKELVLPTHKEMVATVRCEEIAEEKLKLFASNKDWLKLKAAAKKRLVRGFGAKIGLIWSRYLSEYDSESAYFQEDVRNAKRQNLVSDAFDVVHQAYINTLNHLRAEVLEKFERQLEKVLNGGGGYAESVATCRQSCEDEFDERCLDAAANAIKKQAEWDASFVREELVRDVENHALAVRIDKLSRVIHKRQARLATKVSKHLHDLFSLINDKGFSWPLIRSFLKRESDLAASALCSDIASFELDKATVEQKVHDLKQYARELVENKFKEETNSVLQRMKARFMLSCVKEEPPYPECLKVLSTMAAIRLDESPSDGEVERVLSSALLDRDDDNTLASCTWEEVPPEMTLIKPVECKDIWKKFQLDVQTAIEETKFAHQLVGEPLNGENSTSTRAEIPHSEGNGSTEHKSQEWAILKLLLNELPYFLRLGMWLLKDVGHFVLLLRHGNFKAAILAYLKLKEEGIALVKDFPKWAKEAVKNGFKKTQRIYGQIVEKLKVSLMKFYDFMAGLFIKKSVPLLRQ